VYKVRRKPWGPKWLTGNRHRPSGLVCSGEEALCGGRGDPLPKWRSFLVEGDIKVTKGAWRVPKWLAFVASQVVLLGETW
jgi:hypothetical protein